MHATTVPLMMSSSVYYELVPNDPSSLGSLTFEVIVTNISSEFSLVDLVVMVYVPSYDRLDSFDHDCTKGSKCKVVYNAPTRAISIKCPKIKPGVSYKIDMILKVYAF